MISGEWTSNLFLFLMCDVHSQDNVIITIHMVIVIVNRIF